MFISTRKNISFNYIKSNIIKLITEDLAILHFFNDDLYVFTYINIFYFIIFQACDFLSS